MSLPTRLDAQPFWTWAFSDFLSNALRGVLAEYIVSLAADCTHHPRTEWDAFDLLTRDGLKIEVKSAAYLQSWQQRRPSTIRFDIGLKRGWDARTNLHAAAAGRAADVYVFCVFAEQDRAIADPLELTQWFFLVCPTHQLNSTFPNQKSVGLATLERLGLRRLSFAELAGEIRQQVNPRSGS